MGNYESPKPNRTLPCLVLGCVGVLIAVTALGVLVGFFAYKGMTGLVENFTDVEPMELPDPGVTEADYESAKARLDAFKAAVQSNQPTDPLIITSKDINSMIKFDPEFQGGRDNMVVTIEGDRVIGQCSVPLDAISEAIALPGVGILKGRHFNGTAEFDVFMRNGLLYVHLMGLSIKGEPIPEEFTMEMQKQNLAEDFNRQGQLDPVMQVIDSIEVKDGQITVTPKNSTGAATTPETEVPLEQQDSAPAEV